MEGLFIAIASSGKKRETLAFYALTWYYPFWSSLRRLDHRWVIPLLLENEDKNTLQFELTRAAGNFYAGRSLVCKGCRNSGLTASRAVW